jgi:hypothetical protein
MSKTGDKRAGDIWARPGMAVTFRAELMPGVDAEKRTYKVKEVLSSGKVTLHGFNGEHSEKSFVPLQFGKSINK